MPLPRPAAGLVVHYEYVWRHEGRRGEERGFKRRPCLIVAVTGSQGSTEVVVAPITHLEPSAPSEGIEIPRRVKQHLGLDDGRSWIIVTDLNVFTWPGIDLYPPPKGPPGTFDYGFVPPRLLTTVRDRILSIGAMDGATPRTE